MAPRQAFRSNLWALAALAWLGVNPSPLACNAVIVDPVGMGQGTICGDGICDSDEDHASCPRDCEVGGFGGLGGTGPSGGTGGGGNSCGNGTCNLGEDGTSCPADCFCGNGVCDEGENYTTCPEDGCMCGNGTCNPGESDSNCPVDCQPPCGDGACDSFEDDQFSGYFCPADCYCGNGVCDPSENLHVCCAADCPCGEPGTTKCGPVTCDTATEFCEILIGCGEYAYGDCRPVPVGCENDRTCGCTADCENYCIDEGSGIPNVVYCSICG
jgi:hypothetical protein